MSYNNCDDGLLFNSSNWIVDLGAGLLWLTAVQMCAAVPAHCLGLASPWLIKLDLTAVFVLLVLFGGFCKTNVELFFATDHVAGLCFCFSDWNSIVLLDCHLCITNFLINKFVFVREPIHDQITGLQPLQLNFSFVMMQWSLTHLFGFCESLK